MKALGLHFLVDYHGCDPLILNDLSKIEQYLLDAAVACGASVLSHKFHRFSPQGISGVVVIAESHLAIHTWPEHKFAAVDIFTCGEKVDPWAAHYKLKDLLGASVANIREINRGGDIVANPESLNKTG